MNPSKFGGLYVKLNQDIISPNETVTGSIYLDLSHVAPGGQLCIMISGCESVYWKEKETRSRPGSNGNMEYYTVEVVRNAKYQVINSELKIHSWQKGFAIPRGQCVFPFAFRLPEGSPGSFSYTSKSIWGSIDYSVSGFLKACKSKLNYEVDVVVGEHPNIVTNNTEVEMTKNLKTLCCMNQGEVTMKTAFEKNAYTPGDEARILTEFDNSKCALDHKYLTFTLWQTIRIAAGPHKKTLLFKKCQAKIDKIEAGQAFVGEKRKEASLTIPATIPPSTHGKLLQNDFHFELKCHSDGCLCCNAAPKNTLPILLLAKAPPHLPDLELPQNWQPEQMPNVNLVVDLATGNETVMGVSQDSPTHQNMNASQSMIGTQMPYQSLSQQSPQYQPMQPLPTQVQPIQGMAAMTYSQNVGQYPQQVHPMPAQIIQPMPTQMQIQPQPMGYGQMPYQPLIQQPPQYQPMQAFPTQIQPVQGMAANLAYNQYPQQVQPMPAQIQPITIQMQVQPQQMYPNQGMATSQNLQIQLG